MRMHPHNTAHRKWQWRAAFIDMNFQRTAIPVQAAGANFKSCRLSVHALMSALSHGPVFAAAAVERDVQCAMIIGVGIAAFNRPGVVRRKHTADKSNNRQAILAIVA